MAELSRRGFLASTGALGAAVLVAACSSSDPVTPPELRYSLLPSLRRVTIPAAADARAIELGVWFRPSVAGRIEGIRFFRGPGNAGPHVVNLYVREGLAGRYTYRRLGGVQAPDEPAVGWVEARLLPAVDVAPLSILCASYIAPHGRYAVATGADNRYPAAAGNFDSGPLTALVDLAAVGVPSGQMAIRTPPDGRPPMTKNSLYAGFRGADYLVDVDFTTDRYAPPTLVQSSPGEDAARISTNEPVRVKFDQRVTDLSLRVRGDTGEIDGVLVWHDVPSLCATWTARSPMPAGATMTAEVGARSTVGQEMAPRTVRFTTAPRVPPAPPSYWAQWPRAFPVEESFFPLGVFYQTPAPTAAAYAASGFTFFNGGRLDDQFDAGGLAAVAAAGMVALPFGYRGNREYAIGRLAGDPHQDVVRGFVAGDEPDLKSPPVGPTEWAAYVNGYRALDSTRPIVTNMGRLGSDLWPGYRAQTFEDRMADLQAYIATSDVVSADYYGVTARNGPGLSAYGGAVRTMRAASRDEKPVFGYVETCDAAVTGRMPTPAEIDSAVWSCIVNGARGVTYFVHDRPGTHGFVEAGLLMEKYSAQRAQVAATNKRILALAPVLNQATEPTSSVTVATTSASGSDGVTVMAKSFEGSLFVFAVSTVGGIEATFGFPRPPTEVEVLDEPRRIPFDGAGFVDQFTQPYEVHVYRVRTA